MPRKDRTVCDTESDIFAKRLSEAMAICGETQTSLAKKISENFLPIQRQTISLYMSGQSKPDTERLAAICKVLNVSADFLLGFTDCCDTNPGIRATADYTGLDECCLSDLRNWVMRGRYVANDLFCNQYFWTALDAWTEWVNSEHTLMYQSTYESDPDKVKHWEDAADIAWSRVRRAFDRLLAYNPYGLSITDRSPTEGRDLMHRLETYKQREEQEDE